MTEEDERGSVDSARPSFTNTVVAGPAKLKMGWLFKRNRHGFRNWKKRWFVLKSTGEESTLSWYASHEDVFNGVTWGEPNGEIHLVNCVVTDLLKGFRFQILNSDDITNVDDTRLHNREIAASSEVELNSWLEALESHIVESNSGGVSRTEAKSIHARVREIDRRKESKTMDVVKFDDKARRLMGLDDSKNSKDDGGGEGGAREDKVQNTGTAKQAKWGKSKKNAKSFGYFKSIDDWLQDINLPFLSENFETFGNGMYNMKLIEEGGLMEEDLDALQITEKIHRRILISCAGGGFAPDLKTQITNIRDFGGVIVYKIVSHYRVWRSVVYFRFQDFVKLQAVFRSSLKDLKETELLTRLPDLPGRGIFESKTTHLSHEKNMQRMIDLDVWVKALAELVKNDKIHFKLLLENLELTTVAET